MTKYKRVYLPGKRPFYLEVTGESEITVAGKSFDVLTGVQVNKEGDEVRGKGFDERRHVIFMKDDLKIIDCHMSKMFAEIEEDQLTTNKGE